MRTTLRGFWDWWIYSVWIPFYCRLAFFHLMCHSKDATFIIVFDCWRADEPQVTDYYIVSSHWTPWGCRRSASASIFWNCLMDELGPEGRKQVFGDKEAA